MSTKLSLCMIVKASDEEAKLLSRCLTYVASYVDEICLTITGQNEECEKVAKAFKAKVSHFEWVKDFSKARNFNFAQATGDYILWLDCDDVLKGAEKLKGLVDQLDKDHIDAVVMNYLYDFNEAKECTVKHLKTRIVKNDGCVEWVGVLHEDFNSTREISSFFCKDAEVLHLTTEKRGSESADRNLEIALKELSDKPDDPRSLWLVGQAFLGKNEPKKAEPVFREFIEKSHSEEEKYLAYLILSDLIEGAEGLNFALQALYLRPTYPNAYFKIGERAKKENRLDQARNFIEIGLQLPIPETEIIVYNPREYDYYPLLSLLDIAFKKGEYGKSLKTLEKLLETYPNDENLKLKKQIVDEAVGELLEAEIIVQKAEKIKSKKKLKEYLHSLSEKMQMHPKVALYRNLHFVKTETSGKDLAYYCNYTSKEWSPKTTAVGGSEEAVINLTRELAKLGWNITVYNNCGKDAGVYEGVTYRPFWEFNVRDKQDVTIYWRHPRLTDYHEQGGKIFVDMHDVLPPGEFNKARLERIDGIFVKSQAHKDVLKLEDAFIVPNGINTKDFAKKVKKNPYLILNTSSPDRHLDATLDIFEELIKRDPKKPWKLAWYYGWGVYDTVHAQNPEMMAWKKTQEGRFEKLKKEGRAEGGYMLPHAEIAKKYLEAGIFLYPTQFYEIDCISARKAQAAGCKVITSDFAALSETVYSGITLHTSGDKWEKESTFGDQENVENYLDSIVLASALGRWEQEEMNGQMQEARKFNWTEIAKQWDKALKK